MGTTRWSDEDYAARAVHRATTKKPAFAYDHAIKTGATAAKVHDRLDPRGVGVRESRDSATHPESRAVAVLLDHTGSMQAVPGIVQAKLPGLMGLLVRKGYLPHPQILIGGIGDAFHDRSPLQVGQFESGIEIEDDLTRLHLEGGGGANQGENYDLAMYFLARHTSLDCWEKRGQKGFAFVIGDEPLFAALDPGVVERVVGDRIQAPIPVADVVADLKRTFEVFFILPKLTSHWDDPVTERSWVPHLGQNFLRLEDPGAVCELIASTIGLHEGATDLASLPADLAEAGTSEAGARSVSRALAVLGGPTGSKGKGVVATIPDSGAGSGLAVL